MTKPSIDPSEVRFFQRQFRPGEREFREWSEYPLGYDVSKKGKIVRIIRKIRVIRVKKCLHLTGNQP
jgi:hypothetical protein